MDAEDQKDIINKVKEAGQGDEDVAPESDKASDETPSEEPAPESEPSDEEGLAEFRVYENMDNLFVNPKKNNMFQEGSNDILDESDRCTRIAKSKYDVWPSAYASGAVVKCRKGKIWKNLKEEDLKELGDYKSMTDEQLDEKWSQKYKKSIDCDNPKGFSQKAHCQGRKKHDESVEEAAKKTDFSKEKESGLHGWFSRRGGEGSKGWVDCNTCRDGKCKPCGREDGESRAKYPSCRPTPSACKTKGKGDSWGKKSTNESKYNVYENMNFDFVKSAIESASGDKVQKREEDDYGRTLYWSLTNDNIHYFIGNKDGEEVIVLYNAETGERYPIGNLKNYDTSDELNENMGETNNYMFWSNLKTIVHATGELMKMDCNRVDSILSDGHGWALDHMATANDDIEEVYHFLEGQINYEGADAEPMMEHEHESNNYMFWQNLKTMHHGAKEMLEMDPSKVDSILSDGHGWALDHVATSADDVEDVYHFIETEVDSYDGETQGGYSDEYGSVQNTTMNEAEYKGRTVKLGKPMRGDVKKFKVFVKNSSGKVVKVNFGDPNMEIKRDNPKRRKSFRARHKCSQAKDRTTPKYWSCRMWSKKPVSKIVEKDLSESKKSSIFDKNYFKMKMYESFNQEDVMNEPVTEPVVKPSPTRPAEQPVKQPSRKDKPFLPMPSTQPDPKAVSEAYDLVSQFTGDHHGSSMEKNEYLTSLGLDINGIKTLETWINLMIEDSNWRSQKYPQGGSFVEIIRDITKIVGNLKEFIKKYQSVNPIKVTNIIKDKLISSGKPNLNSINEGKFDYETYHKTLSSALDAVRSYAINRGYDEVEFGMNDVQHVPYGHTERLHKELTKDGMPQRKSLNIQIYRMDGGNYELNMYIA